MGWNRFRWSSKGLGGMKVQVTSLGKASNFKVHKASRVWRDKEKFHSPLFRCFKGGHGQSSYLRLGNDQGKIHCVLLIGKSRFSPLKYISNWNWLQQHCQLRYHYCWDESWKFSLTRNYFWTYFKVVLGYISNNSKKFKNLLQTKFNWSEKMQIQINGSKCQPRKIQQVTVPED